MFLKQDRKALARKEVHGNQSFSSSVSTTEGVTGPQAVPSGRALAQDMGRAPADQLKRLTNRK